MTMRLYASLVVGVLCLGDTGWGQAGPAIGGSQAKKTGVAITTATLVDSGNGFNAEFNNTGLPYSIPPSWDDTSIAIVVGGDSGLVLRGREGFESTTGVVSQISWLVAESTMAEDAYISINVGKGISRLPFYNGDTPIAFYVRLINLAGVLKVQIVYPSDAGEVISTWSGTVSVGQIFTTYVEYNIIEEHLIFAVNNETVVTYPFDATSIRSIGSLVIGSSGGSTGRNISVIADMVLEHIIPFRGVAPTGVSVVSPASGATDVGVSATITCGAKNAQGWAVRYGTVNPPVGDYTDLGTTASLGPLDLENNTTYYAQCRATNPNGTTTSAVSSFTTIATTSTGTHPTLLITATRQATWALMRGDYLEDPTCAAQATVNERMGCQIYKAVITNANSTPGSLYGVAGFEAALLANVPGEEANAVSWCLKAYNHEVAAGMLKPTPVHPVSGLNVHRELSIDWVLTYDWCEPHWTQDQIDFYATRVNELFTGILTTFVPNGWRCGDVDQETGNYFGIAAWYYATKDYNPTAVTLWADPDLGGVTASTLHCNATTPISDTARNMIGHYFADGGFAAGGAWPEGAEYTGSAFLGLLGCEALRTTDAGDDPCTEIDTFVDDWAEYSIHRLSRDYQAIYQTADSQEPHNLWMSYFRIHESYQYLALTGVLADGSTRQHLWRQFLNFVATNGVANTFPALYPHRAMALADPYITAATDLTALPKCYPSAGYGIYTWNDSWAGVSSDASQFVVHLPPDVRGYDHQVMYFGDIYLRRKGLDAITHPYAYADAAGITPDGVNGMLLEGLEPSPSRLMNKGPQYRAVNGYTCGSTYLYVSGTTGGLYKPNVGYEGQAQFFNVPEHYVDEYTRSVVYLPSTTDDYDTIYMVDRVAAKDPETLARFQCAGGCYTPANPSTNGPCYAAGTCISPIYWFGPQVERIEDYPSWTSYLFQWVASPTPIVTGAVTSWTLADGQLATDTWLTPDAVSITLQAMDDIPQFNGGTIKDSERHRYRTTIEPDADADWSVLARVITVRDADATAPTYTELSVTGTCLATLISRTGENDVVIVSNSAQGDLIPQQYPTNAQSAAILATARYHKAKTCTIPWTQTTATATVIALDMNPDGIAWTSNLDAAGAVDATPDSSGLKEISVSGTGAHSLDIVGS